MAPTPPAESACSDIAREDQTPTFDPTEPEPVPDFDFDQIHGD